MKMERAIFLVGIAGLVAGMAFLLISERGGMPELIDQPDEPIVEGADDVVQMGNEHPTSSSSEETVSENSDSEGSEPVVSEEPVANQNEEESPQEAEPEPTAESESSNTNESESETPDNEPKANTSTRQGSFIIVDEELSSKSWALFHPEFIPLITARPYAEATNTALVEGLTAPSGLAVQTGARPVVDFSDTTWTESLESFSPVLSGVQNRPQSEFSNTTWARELNAPGLLEGR